ncbi:hypothetical protein O181_030796 [Austropuccinia psidii MF-1]|uniref:Uncharacterized protein n=1 Tax=Austropuccinia psidii MF-1 TaxID=1389203 RepID=A0A9Q3H4K8_9BASI|nr:hypothetical protein [Austropuccinia psidii MF-1]
MEHGKQEVKPGFKLVRSWASFQKICFREISFKDLMEITKGWNPNKQFKLLEERASKVWGNHFTLMAIEDKWSQKDHNFTPSGSQGVDQPNSPVASQHPEYSKSLARSHYSSQFQGVSRRRQGQKGNNMTSFIPRQNNQTQ